VRELADAIASDLSSVENLVRAVMGSTDGPGGSSGSILACQDGIGADSVPADRALSSGTTTTEPLAVIHELLSTAQGKLEEIAGMT
jgi:hypothetical protein